MSNNELLTGDDEEDKYMRYIYSRRVECGCT